MKGFAALLAAAVLALSFPAAADKPAGKTRRVEREGFRIELPKGWGELPEAANNAANGILGASADYTGGAVAAGDPSQGIMVVVFWIRSKEKMPGVRAALEDYHAGIRESLDESGTKVSKWQATELANQLRVAGEGADADVAMRLASIAAVGKDDRLTGWTAVCVHGKPAGAAACADVLASFTTTVADADLKPLEKEKKKTK